MQWSLGQEYWQLWGCSCIAAQKTHLQRSTCLEHSADLHGHCWHFFPSLPLMEPTQEQTWPKPRTAWGWLQAGWFRDTQPCLSYHPAKEEGHSCLCYRAGTAFRGCLTGCTFHSPVRQNCQTWGASCAAPPVSSYSTPVVGTLTWYKVIFSSSCCYKLGRCDLDHDLPHPQVRCSGKEKNLLVTKPTLLSDVYP